MLETVCVSVCLYVGDCSVRGNCLFVFVSVLVLVSLCLCVRVCVCVQHVYEKSKNSELL